MGVRDTARSAGWGPSLHIQPRRNTPPVTTPPVNTPPGRGDSGSFSFRDKAHERPLSASTQAVSLEVTVLKKQTERTRARADVLIADSKYLSVFGRENFKG